MVRAITSPVAYRLTLQEIDLIHFILAGGNSHTTAFWLIFRDGVTTLGGAI